MNRLSICVITLNEAHDLPRLLKSADGIAEEIVVVDSGSTDATVEIAQAAGARVLTRAWTNYAEQKNFAAAQASGDGDAGEVAGAIVGNETGKPDARGWGGFGGGRFGGGGFRR